MAVLIFKQGNYTETGSLAYAEPIFFTDANTLIISGGVSTYTNTEVTPSISAGRVGYRVATIDSINTGSFLVSGDVSASNLLLDGNATVRGNITMGGSGLDFGDASDDNVVFKADISSSFIPNNDDSFDLGSDSQRWKTGYLSNLNLSGSLYVDGGPIDLHSDTYISASSGTFTKLDATTFIDINASGTIDIDSDTSIGIGKNADRPIDIDASTLDIDASSAITIDSTATIAITAGTTASLDGEEAINIGLEERVPVRIEGTSVSVNGSANVDVDADGGKLTLDGSTGIDIGVEADVPIDVDSSTLDIDASGAITISGSGVFDVNAAGALTLDSDTSISIGTDKDKPIDIDASTFDVDASGALTLDSATSISIGTNADVPIDIDSSTLDIDASGAVTLDSTSTISIDGVGNSNFTIDSGNLTINNTTSGNMTLQSAGAIDIDADGGKISIDGSGGIDIGVESDVAIDIDSSTFDLDASGNITLDSTTGINIGTANSGVAISIGHTTSETTINDNLTVTGNFTVNGTTTYVSSSNVTIGDRIIELNYLGASGNGGLYVGDADGTSTSGSLLWDSSNDYWIAGAKDSEHKIMLSNGDSVISGSGTNNQVALFNSTHGLDSDGNLTFDGSNLRVTGTQEITENISGSASGSFKNINVAESQLIGNDLYVGGTIFHKDDTDTRIVFTDDDINITVGNINMIDFTQDTVSEITINEAAQNLDVRIEGEADNKLFFTDASVSKIGIGTNSPGEKLTIHGNVSGSSSGSFKDVKVTDTITSDSGSFGRVIGSIGSTNGVISGSQQVVLGDIPGFNTYTGSVDTEQSAQNTRMDHLSEETGSITNEQAAQDARLTSLEAETGSITTEQSAQDVRLNQLAAATGSYLTSSGSVAFSDITGKPALLSGSLNAGSNVTINEVGGNYFISSSGGGGGGSNNNTITLEATDNVLNIGPDNDFTLNQASDQTMEINIAGGVVSGSSQVLGILTSLNSATGSYALKTTQVTGTTGLSGGGDLSTNRQITLDVSSGTFTDGVTSVVDGLEVISGSAQITAFGFVSSSVGDTLQQVTEAGSSTDQAVQFENTTDSTSKTTGAVTIGGGLGVNNTINAGGDVIAYASSDERLKDNIQPIEGALDKVSQISGNTFDWNEEKQNIYKGKDYGVIAQEIQKVMPELVDTRDSGYLAVKYDKIVPLLIESIKELKKEIEELKSK